ncbi:WecB/TagA/CpsF family glycosyltransferase [Holzapfeliella sp. He02]|uniref:N-acetylglucosaminyldiphosphoundecaprenol N-acetyl-beta-D-mannosaminyltransferase n=1 Tax=Holzapfeliella saturejae TaxID=3082953 RepID=A0ABU8SHB2_9LACO
MSKVDVLGVKFDNYSEEEFRQKILAQFSEKKATFVVTANPEIVMEAREDQELLQMINEADFVTPDGIGVIKAANTLKTPLKERVTGYDLFEFLMKQANRKEYRVYLVGATPEVITAVNQKVQLEYPHIRIVGLKDGYFKEPIEAVAEDIYQAQPDFVFAALGFPKQEQLLNLLKKLDLPAVMMGVGGSFDVFSGQIKRAPKFFQQLHLEWLYRAIKNPSRFKRLLIIPKFLRAVKKQVKANENTSH